MILVDYIIIGVIGVSALLGLIRGFICEVLSLMIWVCAFFFASHYYGYLAVYFMNCKEQIVRNSIAVAILFLSTLMIGMVLNYVIGSLVERTGLSSTDRVLGMCFGVLRGILIISVMLFFLDNFNVLSQSQDWYQSHLTQQFISIINYLLTICRARAESTSLSIIT